jgi:branched-chain amino acid transport system permease protein
MAVVDNLIHINMLIWTTSGEVILMSVLGGIGQFFGLFIGAGRDHGHRRRGGGANRVLVLIICLVMNDQVSFLPGGWSGGRVGDAPGHA